MNFYVGVYFFNRETYIIHVASGACDHTRLFNSNTKRDNSRDITRARDERGGGMRVVGGGGRIANRLIDSHS